VALHRRSDSDRLAMVMIRPVFTHGPPGSGSRAADFQGRRIKKIEIEVWYGGRKGCPQERNLREIYTENNVGTEFSILAIENDLTVKLDFETVISVHTKIPT